MGVSPVRGNLEEPSTVPVPGGLLRGDTPDGSPPSGRTLDGPLHGGLLRGLPRQREPDGLPLRFFLRGYHLHVKPLGTLKETLRKPLRVTFRVLPIGNLKGEPSPRELAAEI